MQKYRHLTCLDVIDPLPKLGKKVAPKPAVNTVSPSELFEKMAHEMPGPYYGSDFSSLEKRIAGTVTGRMSNEMRQAFKSRALAEAYGMGRTSLSQRYDCLIAEGKFPDGKKAIAPQPVPCPSYQEILDAIKEHAPVGSGLRQSLHLRLREWYGPGSGAAAHKALQKSAADRQRLAETFPQLF